MFTAVFFANIPFFIFQIVSSHIPPINLVGLAFAAVLLIVAFVDNFQLPKKFITRLMAVLYILFLVAWVWGRVENRLDKTFKTDGLKDYPEVRLGE